MFLKRSWRVESNTTSIPVFLVRSIYFEHHDLDSPHMVCPPCLDSPYMVCPPCLNFLNIFIWYASHASIPLIWYRTQTPPSHTKTCIKKTTRTHAQSLRRKARSASSV
ncbi:hypothetical protein PoB_007418400 [Plakobranchus ocellatus]|uniref:Uncharacterized protein n=1 Tax=Plakobranchus ocellatus TaxID=259542 RepID=A0AAV4DTY6_9GAST|nr:hypothetical protein PoB_007418400 [Plakobranchus ocellatus]